jgi:hypothetical protein
MEANMSIDSKSIKIIVDEINFVLDKINPKTAPTENLYYFSAVPATINRVLNLKYDQNLLFAFMVIQSTFEALSGSVKNILENKLGVPGFVTPFHFKRLIALTEEFRDKLHGEKNFDATLKKFMILSYSVTGNGHYLMERGILNP